MATRNPSPLYRTLPAGLHQAAEEEAVLRFWREERIFARSVEEREGSEPFVFYEGPPTTNGRPGVHHVLSRTVKDLVCRFWSMEGRQVRRKGGWDTHGLPVEIEVEKELGIEGKEQIEAYGVAEFNARCRKSVFKYKDEWDRITERIGFWLDLEHPYVTLENDYIETVWWCLSRFWEAGNFYSGFKVVPYCPRCQTALSDHEVSLGYKEVVDPSVTVRFRLEEDPSVSILAWTTTPWTLPGNVALAVGEEIPYVRACRDGEELILAKDRLSLLGEDVEVLEEFPGRKLVGKRYRPLFEGLDLKALTGKDAYYVAAADFVTTGEGTGVVHTAVMYGADDYALGDSLDLPKHHTVDRTGHFTDEVPGFAGRRVREVDREIVAFLDGEGLLFAVEDYPHSYPFCWRCDSALLYYAADSWYLRTTAFKDRMLEENRSIRWFPASTGENRFGNWLENNVDWAISRDRYWGTPLPLWRCGDEACGKTICVGGREEIARRGGAVPEDLHRPYVDEVVLDCECGGTMRRLPGVVDVWFDSGSMPFSQWHYPFENEDVFRSSFPADFICEGIDQSRGWFYSLLAISTQITGETPFRNVVANELILDDQGRKMSKRLGNTADPWEVLEAEGADALRWYLISNSPPWVTTRFSRAGVTEAARKFFGTLRNVANFFATYANIDGWRPGAAPPAAERPVLDRWILSRLDGAAESMRSDLRNYQLTRAARTLSEFVQDDLSNWYVRRNRRRFWKGEQGPDKEAAYATLHEVLGTTARLLAPFAPFLAETLHRTLVVAVDSAAPDSVHLARFPASDGARRDPALEAEMERAVALTELARAARTQAGLKVRLPLARLRVLGGGAPPRAEILDVVRDEINVKAVDFVDPEEALDYRLKPNFKKLGPRFGGEAERVARAVRELPPEEVRAGRGTRRWTIHPDGSDPVEIGGEEVDLEEASPPGWVVTEDAGERVALDTRMNEELEREGWIRELVHRLQNLRKERKLEVTDRVRLALGADAPTAETLTAFRSLIENEVLAAAFTVTDPAPDRIVWDVDGTRVTVDLEKAS